MEEKLYTLQEVMTMINVSERTIRRHLRNGQLSGIKIGGEWRFKEQHLRDYFNEKSSISEIVKQSGEVVKMFLKEGVHREKDHVCMILDFVNKTSKQSNFIKQSMMDIASKHKNMSMKFTNENDLIRVTLTGDMPFIQECVNILSQIDQV